MKCPFKVLLFALPISALILFCGASICGTPAAAGAQPAAAGAQDEEEESPPGYELWYNCYQDATKETVILERGKKLIGCITTYPTSTLLPNFEQEYKRLLYESYDNKKYQELETLSEQWLTLHPGDYETIARIADAAWNLGHWEKYIQRATELYKMKPISSLAEGIASAYLKMNNKPKYIEWTETAIKLPENDANFTLRLNLVHTYLEEPKNYPKIMEWAQAALKAAALVQIPSRETQAQLKEVRHFCHDIIGKILLDQDKKFPEAIKAFKQALKVKEYAEGYYFIGICLQSQKKDDAMSWYAKTELWCEKNDKDSKECKELAPKAKANLELIYEKLHDGSTDTRKEYIKAKEKDKIENYWTSEEN